jgi:hypothetical protein
VAHCGLNPNAAGPLDPDAPLLAERDKLLIATLDVVAARATSAYQENTELRRQLAAVTKRPHKSDLSAGSIYPRVMPKQRRK